MQTKTLFQYQSLKQSWNQSCLLRAFIFFTLFCQILKREIAEIRQSSSEDKHVSISVGEKHKRELEQLIKEMEQLKRENKRIREETKQKGKSQSGMKTSKQVLNSGANPI